MSSKFLNLDVVCGINGEIRGISFLRQGLRHLLDRGNDYQKVEAVGREGMNDEKRT